MSGIVSGKIIITFAMVILLGGCSQTAFFGEPATPRGYSGTIPDIETNVYFYFNARGLPGSGNVLSSTDLELATIFRDVESMEFSSESGLDEFGFEMKFGGVGNLDYAVHVLNEHVAGLPVEVEGDGHKIKIFGMGDWSRELVKVWDSGDRVPIQEHIEGADITVRLLPRTVPFEPIALGFIRSPSDHLDVLMTWVGLNFPELGGAIGLMKIETFVIAGYSDAEVMVIDKGKEGLSIGPIAMIGAGRTSYPGFTLDILLGQFAGRIGLEPALVGEETVHYLRMKEDRHLFMKNYGSALFFCFAGSHDDALLLMESVIANQE